jgi:hypothetical protein
MNKKKTTTRDLLMFRIRPEVPSDVELARKLRKAAEVTGIPVSQLLRDGGARMIKDLAKRYPEVAAA